MKKAIYFRNHAYARNMFDAFIKAGKFDVARAIESKLEVEMVNGDRVNFIPLSISCSTDKIRGTYFDDIDCRDIEELFSEIIGYLIMTRRPKEANPIKNDSTATK